MIKKQEPLTIAETRKMLEKLDLDSPRVKKSLDYLKKFSKKKTGKSAEIAEKLSKAEITKLDKQHIVKIADIMPETATELRSIFVGEAGLDSNEIEKILQIVKEAK